MKYEAIEENSSIFEVEKMCKVLELKAPNYYRWKRQKDKGTEKKKQELLEIKKIEKVFAESHKTYGYRKITRELASEGYEISKKIDTELVKRALSNAIARSGLKKGLIFHSDRGCQYASKGYRQMLEENGILASMSRPGCPYDNSCAESFFATIKNERIYRRRYVTMEEVKRDMFQYIELFYNRKRMHSVLGYMSPVAYRLKYDRIKIA